MNDVPEWEIPETGGISTSTVQVSALQKDEYVMIQSRPCKIVDISVSETGEHHIVGIDILTQLKKEDTYPSSSNIDVPIIKRENLKIYNIFNDTMEGYNKNQETVENIVKVPEGPIGNTIRTEFEAGNEIEITVLCWRHFKWFSELKSINKAWSENVTFVSLILNEYNNKVTSIKWK